MDKQGIGGVVCFTLHAAMLLKTLRVSFGGKIGTARRSPHGHPYLVKKKWSSSELKLHHLCEFNCSNGLCVPLFSQCDNKLNCLDFSSFTAERERERESSSTQICASSYKILSWKRTCHKPRCSHHQGWHPKVVT